MSLLSIDPSTNKVIDQYEPHGDAEIDRRIVTSLVLEPPQSIDDLVKTMLVDFGVIAREDLAGSEPAENARIIVEILDGGGSAGARAATILNAAAAIYVSGGVKDFAEGVAAAKQSIDSGAAKAVLERLKEATTKPFTTTT